MHSATLIDQGNVTRRGGLFDYVSPTRLNTWLACPLKFKLKYVDEISEPTSPSLFLGQRVHDALAYLHRRQQQGQSVSNAAVSHHIVETWDDAVCDGGMRFESLDAEEALQRQAIRLVLTYLDECPIDDGIPVAVETPLECPLIDPWTDRDPGIKLFGIVDLVLESAGGFTIVDFKTSARSSAPLEIAHEIQLSCYAWVVRYAFGATERELQIRSLIKTKRPRVEIHRYPARDDGHFRRLFAAIRAYLDDLQSNRFIYRPGWTCSMCAFQDTHCREWQG